MLLKALCIILQPSVNSNWIYGLEMPNSEQIDNFLSYVTLKFDGWPWKTTRHILHAT